MNKLILSIELVSFLISKRRWELIPGVILILVIGVVIAGILASPVAPVIYPLF